MNELKENETYPTLSEEMEKLLNRTSEDLMSTLVNLSGSLKDIECGTRIKIPIPAGFVSCYKLDDALEMSLWLKEVLMDKEPISLNRNDET